MERISQVKEVLAKTWKLGEEELSYFVHTISVNTSLYNSTQGGISIAQRDGTVVPLPRLSPIVSDEGTTGESKTYLLYPREIAGSI